MKNITAIILLACLLAGMLGGCTEQTVSVPPISLEKPYIGFSATHANQIAMEDYTQVELSTFDSYDYRYGKYSTDIYYAGLSGADQKVYHILQYAMDNAYPCILIDERVTAGMQYSVEDILTFFSLDSAVVEQNLAWEFGEFTVTYTATGATTQTKELKGMQLYISDFSAQKQQKKEQAIAKAAQILEAMPVGLSQQEQARYFYNWLGENVTYFLDKWRDENADYLYDALCGGKTNCDGFANAFSLLCSMADISCLEKIYVPADGSAGHTWNTVELDGVWYNVDATASHEVGEQPQVLFHFGFEDGLQEYACEYATQLPACQNNLLAVDCRIDNADDAAGLIKEGFEKAGKDYVIAVFTGGPVEQAVLEQIAQAVNCSINTRHYVVADGSAVYCIFKS